MVDVFWIKKARGLIVTELKKLPVEDTRDYRNDALSLLITIGQLDYLLNDIEKRTEEKEE